jgi:crotonobetainyl-CoA:carnitine CoA-transferase CaiB-like acyl-CoA transferase
MNPNEQKEEIYTRHASSRQSDLVKSLAEIMDPDGKPEALDDVLVLDASHANFSGIIAASFFAEFGAEVIKIEPPSGDPARLMTPFGQTVEGVGIPFLFEGRNKRYMTLDLQGSDGDRQDFLQLAKKAAVVIETFPPGDMDDWGSGTGSCPRKPGPHLHRHLALWSIYG